MAATLHDPTHIHLDGAPADHAEWTANPAEDDFDAEALERAMVESRRRAYTALQGLDAA